MAESNRDRILPSLLDRLTDEAPGSASSTRSASVTLSELRSSVLRDLNWLFNAVRSLRPEEVEANPQVRNSVLNYGLPALSGKTATKTRSQFAESCVIRLVADSIISPQSSCSSIAAATSSVLDARRSTRLRWHLARRRLSV